MNTKLFHNVTVSEALEDAKRMGFENIFIIRKGKLVSSLNKKTYDPKDLAIVESKEVILEDKENGILLYAVSCDGELGLVIGKEDSDQLSNVVEKMLVE